MNYEAKRRACKYFLRLCCTEAATYNFGGSRVPTKALEGRTECCLSIPSYAHFGGAGNFPSSLSLYFRPDLCIISGL